MAGRAKTAIYLALPLVLWPLSFDVFSGRFVYCMAFSTLLLGLLTIAWFRGRLRWFKVNAVAVVLLGALFAFVMYAVFVGGDALLKHLGLSGYVALVYSMVEHTIGKYELAAALIVIGIMEELYWRGGLQELMRGVGGLVGREPWLLSMTYYTLVHLSTLNPALVAGAFAVGLIDGLLADKVGLAASAITHVLWLELMMVLSPL